MAALDGAAWMAAHARTKEGFKTWLKDLADDAQIPVADFVGYLAVELKSSSLLSEAEYGKEPTSLQKGRLYNRLAEARVQIDDIPIERCQVVGRQVDFNLAYRKRQNVFLLLSECEVTT